jgi:endonuclease YncB( thermonuclease family)
MSTFLALLLVMCQAEPPLKVERHWDAISAYEIHDADTLVDVTIPLGYGVFIGGKSVRFHGVDAWESNRTRQPSKTFPKLNEAQWKDEIAKGIKARDALAKLAAGGTFYLDVMKHEAAFNRIDAVVYLRTTRGEVIDVAKWLKANGHDRTAKPSP